MKVSQISRAISMMPGFERVRIQYYKGGRRNKVLRNRGRVRMVRGGGKGEGG